MCFFPHSRHSCTVKKKRNIVVDACFSQPHYPWSSLLVQLVLHLMSLNHFFHSAMKLLAPEQHNIPILSLPTIIKFSAINLLWAILDLLHKDMSFLLRELFFCESLLYCTSDLSEHTLLWWVAKPHLPLV